MKRKPVFIVGTIAILLGVIFGCVNSLKKTIDKTVQASVYIDGKVEEKTSIVISGIRKDSLISLESEYVGE